MYGVASAGYMFVTEINKRDKKIANQKAMIENRDDLIDKQRSKITKIKTILKTDDLYINKVDRIKEVITPGNVK